MDVIDCVDSVLAYSQSDYVKTRVGKLSGIVSTNFGSLSGYGLYASGSAYLEGSINATSGKIGGWTINSTTLADANDKIVFTPATPRITISDGSNERMLIGKIDSTYYGILGKDTSGNTLFKISNDASNPNLIGGWAIENVKLTSGRDRGNTETKKLDQDYITQAGAYSGPTAYQQFMSPYQQDVIDKTLTEFDKQAQAGITNIGLQAAKSGNLAGG